MRQRKGAPQIHSCELPGGHVVASARFNEIPVTRLHDDLFKRDISGLEKGAWCLADS